MLAYVNNRSICRNKQLLKYFGETTKDDCGVCDYCLNNQSENRSNKNVVTDVINLLKTKSSTSREIIRGLQHNETTILSSLRDLLEDGTIKINTLNEYELTT
jgi:ATP-dependent DNA helicase RecQ